MTSYQEKFKDSIHLGRNDDIVMIGETTYKEIQREALEHALRLVTSGGEYVGTVEDAAGKIRWTIDHL